MANIVSSLTLKIGDNVCTINGLTANDISKIKTAIAQVSENATAIEGLETALTAINKGQAKIAFKDLSNPENQSDMETGVYYNVPFNKGNQFIEFDEATLLPKEEQSVATEDANLHHFDVYVKSSTGSVSKVGTQMVQVDFSNFVQTNSNAALQSLTISETQDKGTLGDDKAPKFGTVKAYADEAVATAKSEAISETMSQVEGKNYLTMQYKASKPNEGEIAANTIIVFPATDLLAD